ncbi:hypothetical protein NQ315_017599 [Exocentrus adspersus]|uniref:BTB domain-containing protein n=1 Tax=Exocentrus adspersus TaxID=1586481 RepID=A0AAV8V5R7_9CUCU|nr:hypothetical protein NQ315_017599 [Exocentrus adspersus]
MAQEPEPERFFTFENFYNHTLSEKMYNFLTNKQFVDVTLVCLGEEIMAHKVVLAAFSQLFQELLLKRSEQNPIIILRDISKAELMPVLEFIYKGNVSLPSSVIPSFLKTIKDLKIEGVEQQAEAYYRTLQNGRADPGKDKTPSSESRWLKRKSPPKRDSNDSTKVRNPFAKRVRKLSSTGSDTTVFDADEKSANRTSSPINNSDVEIIDHNPTLVVIHDTQQMSPDMVSKAHNFTKSLASKTGAVLVKEEQKNSKKTNSPKRVDALKVGINPMFTGSKNPNKENKSPTKAARTDGVDVLNEWLEKRSEELNCSVSDIIEDLNRSLKERIKDGNKNPTTATNGEPHKINSRNIGSEAKTTVDTNLFQPGPSTSSAPAASEKSRPQSPKRLESPKLPENFADLPCYKLKNYCVVCLKFKKNLGKHVQKYHNNTCRTKLICDVCSKTFSSLFPALLAAHKRKCHG